MQDELFHILFAALPTEKGFGLLSVGTWIL